MHELEQTLIERLRELRQQPLTRGRMTFEWATQRALDAVQMYNRPNPFQEALKRPLRGVD